MCAVSPVRAVDGWSLWDHALPAITHLADDSARPDPADVPAPVQRFGTHGQEWLTVTAGYGHDFARAHDMNLAVAYSRFLDDDFEWIIEAGAWYYDQRGDNAAALNAAMIFRYHLVNEDRWTFFVDLGIGVQVATDAVPQSAKHFGFTPRAGVGGTLRLDEGATRLIGGVRWHHVSNGHLWGDDDNDPHDAAVFYLGLMFRLP